MTSLVHFSEVVCDGQLDYVLHPLSEIDLLRVIRLCFLDKCVVLQTKALEHVFYTRVIYKFTHEVVTTYN